MSLNFLIRRKAFIRATLFAFVFVFFNQGASAQFTFDFTNAVEVAATPSGSGYQVTGVGTYYRSTSGQTVSLINITCGAFNKAVVTGSSLFIFRPEFPISAIKISGTGTGSNRIFSTLAINTSTNLNGSYATSTQTNSGGIGTGGSSNCGEITVTPSAIIDAGTYLRLTFSGNINVTSIELVPAVYDTPSIQTSAITFANVTYSSTTLNWVNGNGSKRMVFVKEGTGAITNPVNGTIYTPNANWNAGSPAGTQLGTSGYYCVYNGNLNSVALTNLKAGTTYTVQAFEYNGDGVLSKILTTTTIGNPNSQATKTLISPVLTTNPITSVFSTKGTSGGIVIDNGGLAVTETGLVWSTTANPTISSTGILKIGANDAPFTGQMKGLSPSTTYFVRAYAINALGTSYGNQQQFTTAAPGPVLTSSVASLDFGSQFYNSEATVLTYNLVNNGANFSTATGNITVTATAGFQVSRNPTTGFASSILVPFTNSQLPRTPIYVRLPTNLYGIFTGEIIHSGANVLAGDADIVKLQGLVVQEEISNKGTDFWLGFGYMSDMNNTAGDSDAAKMIVYVATGNQEANVSVMMPNGQYSQSKIVPPNTIEKFENFPIADNANSTNAPDSRLFATGVQDKAIHVASNGVPVSVWTYTYTRNNSAAGAMIFPTNTWSSSYTVQAYGNISNARNPNSFFFVIPEKDNTTITFKPSVDIVKSIITFSEGNSTPADVAYLAGQTYTVNLNKGQIFNAMGFIQGTGARNALGLDLSGTTITTNDCDKKIAVFAGNGRTLASASFAPNTGSPVGGDNIIQQMFPTIAWGTRYLTVPTKTMEYNIFRIYVEGNLPANTIVKINGTTLDASFIKDGLYYEYEANIPLFIEGNKPISVTQLILSESWASRPDKGNSGYGDPEMIVLSPVQQAIKSSIIATPDLKGRDATQNPRSSYINVVIKKEGVASFKLDGTSLALDTGKNSFDVNNIDPFGASAPVDAVNAFKVHPHNPDYFFAKLRVTMGEGIVHTVSSDFDFNAIAYGLGKGESYAFNAGSNVQNLTSIKLAVNTSATDTSSTTVKAAKDTPVRLKIALPYPPATVANLLWSVPSSDPSISPAGSSNGAVSGGVAVNEGTIIVQGRTFYIYSSPVLYTFSESGNHPINVIVSGTFGGDCGGSDLQKIPVLVGLDDINTAYTTNCGNPTITFTNTTIPMAGTTITKWLWDFGDGSTSALQNPPAKTYNKNNGSVYTVKLTTTNSAGIVSFKTMLVDFSGEVIAKFTNNAIANSICLGNEVRFDPASSAITSAASGTAIKWTWNFGDGTAQVIVNGPAKTIQPHTYTVAGQYTVSLILETSTGCTNTFTQTVNVFNLTATVVSSVATQNSIEFKWTPVANATSYEVSIDGGLTFITPSSGSTGLSHTVTGLNPNQTVNILVIAKALGACQSQSLPYNDKTLLPDLDVFMPNVFTPNGDNKNDVFLPYSNYMQSVTMRIFNQWGQEVFFSTELNKGWDGTFKGTEQPVGVYIYVVTVVMQNGNKVNKKGSLNLIR